MGIPNLYSLLRPYAQPVTFPPPTSPDTDKEMHLYIDGPALAHHVYHSALNENYYDTLGRVRRNPFDAVVDYDEFVKEVGSFLGRLEEVGFFIKKIFFDGYLPPAKLPTRINRLTTSLSQLLSYHSLHSTHIPSFNSAHRHASSHTQATPTSRLHNLPSPPFIVGTALSYLTGQKWGNLVETVPGEADAWCASAAVREGGWVISGDTDLLLYGHEEDRAVVGEDVEKTKGVQDWGVIMFRDLRFFEEKMSDGTKHCVAKGAAFHPYLLNKLLFGGDEPATISGVSSAPPIKTTKSSSRRRKTSKKRIALPTPSAPALMDQFNLPESTEVIARPKASLLNLAYHLQNEPTAGLTRLKQLVKSASLHPDISQREQAFKLEYALVSPPSNEVEELPSSGRRQDGVIDIEWQLKHLDPRFSEIMYQLPCLAKKVHPPTPSTTRRQTTKAGGVEELEVNSFLPFLYEDPTRSGAWDVGRDIRRVVYSILEAYQNKISSEQTNSGSSFKLIVKEYVRRGKRIKDVVVKCDENYDTKTQQETPVGRILSSQLASFIHTWKDKRNTLSPDISTKRGRSCECLDFWWVEMVVEMVVADYAEKGKDIPISSEVGVILHMLCQAVKRDNCNNSDECGEPLVKSKDIDALLTPVVQTTNSPTIKEQRTISSNDTDASPPPPRWTWSMIHLFAQIQAGVYSLWMLKQLMVFALALGDTITPAERENVSDLASLLNRIPPVERVIAGKIFLEGLAKQNEGVDQRCDNCGWGEESIMTILLEKWHIKETESELEGIDMAKDGNSELWADDFEGEEEEERDKIKATWGGMDVDF